MKKQNVGKEGEQRGTSMSDYIVLNGGINTVESAHARLNRVRHPLEYSRLELSEPASGTCRLGGHSY